MQMQKINMVLNKKTINPPNDQLWHHVGGKHVKYIILKDDQFRVIDAC